MEQANISRCTSARSVKQHAGYAYWAAAVYEAKARKTDGVMTWRRVRDAGPDRRSLRLAHSDALKYADARDYIYLPDVRHGSPVADTLLRPIIQALKGESR